MKKTNGMNAFAIVSGFAVSMIVIIGICVFLGVTLDSYLHTNVVFTIIFSVFGIFAGVYNLIRGVSKLEEQDGKNDAFFKSFPIVWIVTIVVGSLLWILWSDVYGISFILGSVTSLMMMSMLYKSSGKILEQETKIKAQRLAMRNYFFRYFFYAIILITTALHPNLSVLAAGVGLFMFKIVFYFVILIDKRGDEQND